MNHPSTTDEIKKCCEDIKVLGKKDLRNLISWWKTLKDASKQNNIEKTLPTKLNDKKNVNNFSSDEEELHGVSKQIKELEVRS